MTDLAPLRAFIARKDAVKSGVENLHEMIFYLKSNYSPDTEERAFIEDISQDDKFSFEEMSDSRKNVFPISYRSRKYDAEKQNVVRRLDSKSIKVFRRKNMRGKNLSSRFDDWMFRECKIKKQSIYNYKNLYKLMRIAPKLLNGRVNMTYFVKKPDILLIVLMKTKNRHR